MASASAVSALARQLHDSKLLNLEASLESVLSMGGLDTLDPGGTRADYVIAWEHYVVVCGAAPGIAVINPGEVGRAMGRVSEGG
jgi:hypothetical protein